MSLKDKSARKQYQKEYHQKWYANPKNKQDKKANAAFHNKKNIERNRLFIRKYKESHPCQCGESRFQCLDFHHIDSNTKSDCISNMVVKPVGLQKLQLEIAKCIVLCRNCHAVLHTPVDQR